MWNKSKGKCHLHNSCWQSRKQLIPIRRTKTEPPTLCYQPPSDLSEWDLPSLHTWNSHTSSALLVCETKTPSCSLPVRLLLRVAVVIHGEIFWEVSRRWCLLRRVLWKAKTKKTCYALALSLWSKNMGENRKKYCFRVVFKCLELYFMPVQLGLFVHQILCSDWDSTCQNVNR